MSLDAMRVFGHGVQYLRRPSDPPATHVAGRSLLNTMALLSEIVMTSPNAPRAADRRVQRSQRALQSALFQLMLEKGYGDTSVSDITERANVGRSTFYAHFADKEDLLQQCLQGLRSFLTDETIVGPEREGPTHPALSFSLPMFLHAAEQRRLFRSVMEEPNDAPVQHHLQQMFVDLVTERLSPAGQAPSPEVVLQARFIVGAFLGVLMHWVVDDEAATPQQVDLQFRRMMMGGLESWVASKGSPSSARE